MIISNIKFKNWKNFTEGELSIGRRLFVVGSNASGKSNFLDIFRFLRDIASASGGGLQKAIKDRGGLGKVRSLAARRYPNVYLEIELTEEVEDDNKKTTSIKWKYILEIGQEAFGRRRPIIKKEQVFAGGENKLDRPNDSDKLDPERLTQTHLEQVNANQEFRSVVDFLSKAVYLHLVPQLLKHGEGIQGNVLENDPFGQGFLERIAQTGERKRQRRLKKIQSVLKKAVPQLQELQFERDEVNGKPHLRAKYFHWRVNGAWQREDQFSDGTLRLIGLFWILQEDPGLLLIEEPELSLNGRIVSYLAPFIHQLQGDGQVIVTTHSSDLLSDQGISLEEVALLEPSAESTKVSSANSLEDVTALVESGGMDVGSAILPHATPAQIESLASV